MPKGLRRTLSMLLAVSGLLALAWALTVYFWRDPLTSTYTLWEQRRLQARYDALAAQAGEFDRGELHQIAARYRAGRRRGDPIARLRVPRLDLDMILLEGTDTKTLQKGPGRYRRSAMPGEGRLVYVAGHRTTYSAPFSHIERLQPGDPIELRVPYGTFVYEVTGYRIVDDEDLSVLRSPQREILRLQACHPRFFATQRYIVSARLVRVSIPPGRSAPKGREISTPARVAG
jgi:sortase A